MDIVLIVSAVVLFVFGVILLFKPDTERKISDWLNKNLFPIEDKMRSSNKLSGLLLIVLGIVIYMLAAKR
ncbi:MAG: hypothetical protein NT036_01290 [Candidatus Omnitrophica bacterium]|nr:hypothetical protein [Candidatus Omnitrophota bacterium]